MSLRLNFLKKNYLIKKPKKSKGKFLFYFVKYFSKSLSFNNSFESSNKNKILNSSELFWESRAAWFCFVNSFRQAALASRVSSFVARTNAVPQKTKKSPFFQKFRQRKSKNRTERKNRKEKKKIRDIRKKKRRKSITSEKIMKNGKLE